MGMIKTLNQDKQQEASMKLPEEQFPKKEDGTMDIMKMIDNLFPEQPNLQEYMKEVCKGYALQMCMQSAEQLIQVIKGGKLNIEPSDFVPQELAPTMNMNEKPSHSDK